MTDRWLVRIALAVAAVITALAFAVQTWFPVVMGVAIWTLVALVVIRGRRKDRP